MKSITKRLLKKKSIPRDTDTSSNTIDVVAFENTEINEDAPKDDDTSSSEVVFEYTGNEHVPKEVTHVQFHPKVTDTNANAFIERTKLRQVVLNEGLQVIDFGTFEYCTTLTSIAFPSTVTEVRKGAFEYCVNLRDVVLNEGLQKIGTFKYCESLESITLPSTVTELEQFAFCMCINLKEVVLNEGLLKIPPHTFNSCSSLERIAIPSTVVEIGSGAFQGCDNLREVLLHENIEKMEKFGFNVNAFGGCRSLERFDFPSLSARLDSIIRAGQIDIIVKIDGISSVERDDNELFVTATAMGGGRNMGSEWNTVKESLDEIVKLITYYEVKEATTLFELALWKARIDQADDADGTNRDAHRIEVPGPVKNAILQYIR